MLYKSNKNKNSIFQKKKMRFLLIDTFVNTHTLTIAQYL